MSRSHSSSKPPAWISWLAVPWRDVAELAVDRIDLASHGVDLTVETRFDSEQVGAADTSMTDAISAIPQAMPPERFTYTLPGPAAGGAVLVATHDERLLD